MYTFEQSTPRSSCRYANSTNWDTPYPQPDRAMLGSNTNDFNHSDIQWTQVVPMNPVVPQYQVNYQAVAAPNNQFIYQPDLNRTTLPPVWTVGTGSSRQKPKRIRTAFTTDQIMLLEREYSRSRYLDRARRLELANLLQLPDRILKVWFQNRRMKQKKETNEANMQMPYTQMPVANIIIPAIPVTASTTAGIVSQPFVITPSLMFSQAPAQLNLEVGAQEVGAQAVGAQEIRAQEIRAQEMGAQEMGAQEMGAQAMGAQEMGPQAVGAQELVSVERAVSCPSDPAPFTEAWYSEVSSWSLPSLTDLQLD